MRVLVDFELIIVVPAPSIPGFFFAAHHAGSAALGTDEFSLLVGRMGQLPHLDLAFPTEHCGSHLVFYSSF